MGRNLATRLARTIGAVAVILGTVTGATVVSMPAASAATVANLPSSFETRHVSQFGVGIWWDACNGDEYVSIPLNEYLPGFGFLPNPWARVQVQEWSVKRGRWVVRATLVTDASGVATDLVHLGGGRHILRAVHLADDDTQRAIGRRRVKIVTTEPCDII
jgi:hypothetical protein